MENIIKKTSQETYEYKGEKTTLSLSMDKENGLDATLIGKREDLLFMICSFLYFEYKHNKESGKALLKLFEEVTSLTKQIINDGDINIERIIEFMNKINTKNINS